MISSRLSRVLKVYTLHKIEILMFILLYDIFPKNLIILIKDLRKYCDSTRKYFLMFNIQNIHTSDRFSSQGQFLQKSMSALKKPRIARSRIFTTSTRHNIADSLREIEHVRTYLRPVLAGLTAVFASEFRMMRHVGRECE